MTDTTWPPSVIRHLLDRMWEGGWSDPADVQAQRLLRDYLATMDRPAPLIFTSQMRPPFHLWTLGSLGNVAEVRLSNSRNVGLSILHRAASSPGRHVDITTIVPELKGQCEMSINALRLSVLRAVDFVRTRHVLLAGMLEGITVRNDFTAIYTPHPDDPEISTKLKET